MTFCTFIIGDNRDVLRRLPDDSIDAVVTDPPYGLGKEPDMAEVLGHWLAGDDYDATGGGFMGKCLHPDTDVLTFDGWKPVGLVTASDLVCSLNPDSGQIEYVGVDAVHEYEYDGDLLRVGGRSSLQVVTPNHNVWTDAGLVRADHLPPKFKVLNQGEWIGVRQSVIDIEGASFPTIPLMQFLGLWLGDGYATHRVAQPWKQDFLGFNVAKQRKIEAVRSALSDLGVKFTETPGARITAFYVYDKNLFAWLSEMGGAATKFIPSWVFSLDREALDALYVGMMGTDGHTNASSGQQVYYTTSEQLADDFQRLCLHTGRSAVKTYKEFVSNFGAGAGWTLSVVQSRGGFWMARDGVAQKQPPSVVSMPWAGGVHCLTLERNHVMMTRFNGKTAWTGNSWDSFVPGPATWREVYRVLKPGGHLLSFSGTRTFDMAALAIRLAGFEVRDCLSWMYGQGFPKSMDVSKAIDKAGLRAGGHQPELAVHIRECREATGLSREEVASWFPYAEVTKNWERTDAGGRVPSLTDYLILMERLRCSPQWVDFVRGEDQRRLISTGGVDRRGDGSVIGLGHPGNEYEATTDIARQWEGWGTALKPAWESIVWATKPGDCATLDRSLSALEESLWSSACASGAETPSGSSPAVCDVGVFAGAQWRADAPISTWADSFVVTDTSWSGPLAATTCWNIVRSWRLTLGDLLRLASTSTIATGIVETTDWTTLNSLASRITPESIIQGLTHPDGSRSPADGVLRYFSDVSAKLSAIPWLSAPVSVTGGEHISPLGGGVLRPNWEPIILARKPLIGTVAANVLAHGTGALNIDATRISTNGEKLSVPQSDPSKRAGTVGTDLGFTNNDIESFQASQRASIEKANTMGRFPANVLLSHHENCQQGVKGEVVEAWECVDSCPVRMLDEQTGTLTSGKPGIRGEGGAANNGHAYGAESRNVGEPMVGFGDSGGASRFFYTSKAPKKERNAGIPDGGTNDHATVKSVALMEWLIKLVTPPNGIVLDPFAGSGSTVVAAVKSGFNAIGMELDPHYVNDIAVHRVRNVGGEPDVIVDGGSS